MFKLAYESYSTQIIYEIEEVGEDLEISITGGSVHIGAIALVSEGSYDILSVRNHKEFELIQPLAKKLTRYEDITILIKAGVHVDDITLDEIKQILNINKRAIDEINKYICYKYDIFHEF